MLSHNVDLTYTCKRVKCTQLLDIERRLHSTRNFKAKAVAASLFLHRRLVVVQMIDEPTCRIDAELCDAPTDVQRVNFCVCSSISDSPDTGNKCISLIALALESYIMAYMLAKFLLQRRYTRNLLDYYLIYVHAPTST